MANNHLPGHDGPVVNAIKGATEEGLIKNVLEVKSPMKIVHANFAEA